MPFCATKTSDKDFFDKIQPCLIYVYIVEGKMGTNRRQCMFNLVQLMLLVRDYLKLKKKISYSELEITKCSKIFINDFLIM